MKEEKTSRILVGEVVFDGLDKTITVSVDRIKTNRLYKKKYKVSKKYLVNDEKNEYKTGDVVEIKETKPLSKNKHFEAVRKVS
ncbi:MAG: 30S ribosomal protein S17 [Patescibacteria group bacterium]|jgi:small subunit ribosomal protein S17